MNFSAADIKLAADWIRSAGPGGTVAFSGAGASAESGISTFRDRGGIWERYGQEEVGTPNGIAELWRDNPVRLGTFLKELVDGIALARPNPGHFSLAALEQAGWLSAVLTQNVDHLHQTAGSRVVIEVHGSLIQHRCIDCQRPHVMRPEQVFAYTNALAVALRAGRREMHHIPVCQMCHAPLRPDIVLFTEPVPRIAEAFAAARKAEVLLIIGTSGVVQPAAQIPQIARQSGARLIEINSATSGYSDQADLYIQSTAGMVLPQILHHLGLEMREQE